MWPSSSYTSLLSSITSTELQKITFRPHDVFNRMFFAHLVEAWDVIDKALCGLVDRLRATGHRYTLEVELRLGTGTEIGMCDFTKFLPGFGEKGVMTIVDREDRVLHSSTQTR